MNQPEVVIIGAGISGLTAAIGFQKAGISYTILEKSDRPGGRIKTIHKNGFTLDAGFQVLHPNYNEVRQIGVWDSLDFRPFRSGAILSRGNRQSRYSNPFSDPLGFISGGLKFPFPPGEILAAFRLFRDALASDENFQSKHSGESCIEYLNSIGISDKTIREFFVPFFGGVFLDQNLGAGSPYFLWLFKKFLQGRPGLPMGGMQSLPYSLASMLPADQQIQLGMEVKGIENGTVYCRNGRQFQPNFIVDAANLSSPRNQFQGTRNYYFEGPSDKAIPDLLVLNGNKEGEILHFCFPTAVHSSYAPSWRSLCSVTLRRTDKEPAPELILQELSSLYPSVNWSAWNFLESFYIQKAIPVHINGPRPLFSREGNVFRIGDVESYPSINGAMRSGREAAETIVRELRTGSL